MPPSRTWSFVLTRPFGATVGDVLTKPREKGGLAFGTIGSSAVVAAVLVGLVVWSTIKERSARLPATSPASRPQDDSTI